MKKIAFAGLMLIACNGYADVFKCKSAKTGQIEYQADPCASSTVEQAIVDVKPMTAQEQEQAQLKLDAWRAEQAAHEREKIRAEKELQDRLDKQAELNALSRSATAAERQALAAQQLAGQIEHQNRINSHNSLYEPRHRYHNDSQGYQSGVEDDADADDHRRRHGHEGRHVRRHNQALSHQGQPLQPPHQLGDYGLHRPAGSLGEGLAE